MNTRRFFLIGCTLALGLFLVPSSYAQPPSPVCRDVEYFPETNHNVCDQFLEFFKTRGGAAIFGYPITEAFVENGRLVQYFQRVRMEHHPDQPAAYHVQLGLLGDGFAPADRKARIDPSKKPKSNDPARRYFSETGHTVQHSFLRFYSEKGGLDIFGYPVTEFFEENGRFVQYFQRALMEWDPNQNGIVLHDLGEILVAQQSHLRPLRDSAPQLAPSGEKPSAASTVTALQATASVRYASASREDLQTAWVYVNDQNGTPLAGAHVTLVLPDSASSRIPMPPTDELGHTEMTFGLENISAGQMVIVEVWVHYQGLETRAKTFFLVWL